MTKRNKFEQRVHERTKEHIEALVKEITDAVRRNVVADFRSYFEGGEARTSGRADGRRRSHAAGRNGVHKRNMTCIAPGCAQLSKGPRFHYLCEKHKDAPESDYISWRQAARARTR